MITTLNLKNYKLSKDLRYNFIEVFNLKTGEYKRSGIIDSDGKDTDVDPFMRSFPGLLDIGIMGGCKAASRGLCRAGGSKTGCYQGARKYDPDKDMKLEDYKKIIDEGAVNGLQQVALGGAGNPNDHKDFIEILKYTREKDIIPNYTTAGIGLTDEMVEATKKYCGAVAVSWYIDKNSSHNTAQVEDTRPFTLTAIDKFVAAGCKTNIHYVLSKETIDDAIEILENNKITVPHVNSTFCEVYDFKNVNAIIFLLYKPVGLGSINNMLTLDDNDKLQKFFSLVTKKEHTFKIGFDSCTVPALLKYNDEVNRNSLDTCEGARFSAYINANMVMVPCSFDQKLNWGVSLKDHTVEKAWDSDKFKSFRRSLSGSCSKCDNREYCMGGCPIKNEIVICDSEYRDFKKAE